VVPRYLLEFMRVVSVKLNHVAANAIGVLCTLSFNNY
jgi:hypothetical protein